MAKGSVPNVQPKENDTMSEQRERLVIELTVCGRDYSQDFDAIPRWNQFVCTARTARHKYYNETSSVVSKKIQALLGTSDEDKLEQWRTDNEAEYNRLMWEEADKHTNSLLHERMRLEGRGPRVDPLVQEYNKELVAWINAYISDQGPDPKVKLVLPKNAEDFITYADGTKRTRAQLLELAPRVSEPTLTNGYPTVGDMLMDEARKIIERRANKKNAATKAAATSVGM